MKNNDRGITLVALVVTIIILIILATVSTTMILGNSGLLNRAKQAREMTIQEQKNENGIYDQGTEYVDAFLDDAGYEVTAEPGTYVAYTLGQKVTIGTDENAENFYVIENSDDTKGLVKLITEKCINIADGYKQSDYYSDLEYDNEEPYSNLYANSLIKPEVEKYKAALQQRTGKIVRSARLLTEQEARSIDSANVDVSRGTTPKLRYWIDGPMDSEEQIWYVNGNTSGIVRGHVYYTNAGLRPVITVSKTQLN